MIGLRQGTVELVPYDEVWVHEFTTEERRLRAVFGDTAEIEHVGSTAIPGMIAKPLIDIQVALPRLSDAQRYIATLVQRGYAYMPERDKPDEVFMPKGLEESRTHYLHIVEKGSPRYRGTIIFRNYLRAHPEAAREYADLKLQLAAKYADYRPAYTEGKSEFVSHILQLAHDERS